MIAHGTSVQIQAIPVRRNPHPQLCVTKRLGVKVPPITLSYNTRGVYLISKLVGRNKFRSQYNHCPPHCFRLPSSDPVTSTAHPGLKN